VLRPHFSQLWADLPTDLWAIQPTGREIMDLKTAVSMRVKLVIVNINSFLRTQYIKQKDK
jgi:hypothetical protein